MNRDSFRIFYQRYLRRDFSSLLLSLFLGVFFLTIQLFLQEARGASPFTIDLNCEGDVESVSPLMNLSSNEIYRGNLGELKIEPFKFRCVGNFFGDLGRHDGSDWGTNPGLKMNSYGGMAGAEWLVSENCILGGHLIAGQTAIDPEDANQTGSITQVGGLARLGLFGNLWYTDLSLGGANNENQASFLSAGERVEKSKNLLQMNYQGEFGLKLKSGYTKIEPFLDFRAVHLSKEGIPLTEKRYLFNSDKGTDSYRSLLGSRFAWEYAGYMATFTPQIRGAWVHEYGDKSIFMSNDFLPFPIAGQYGDAVFSRDRMVLGVGLTAALRDMVDLYFDYNAEFNAKDRNDTLWGGFNVKY